MHSSNYLAGQLVWFIFFESTPRSLQLLPTIRRGKLVNKHDKHTWVMEHVDHRDSSGDAVKTFCIEVHIADSWAKIQVMYGMQVVEVNERVIKQRDNLLNDMLDLITESKKILDYSEEGFYANKIKSGTEKRTAPPSAAPTSV